MCLETFGLQSSLHTPYLHADWGRSICSPPWTRSTPQLQFCAVSSQYSVWDAKVGAVPSLLARTPSNRNPFSLQMLEPQPIVRLETGPISTSMDGKEIRVHSARRIKVSHLAPVTIGGRDIVELRPHQTRRTWLESERERISSASLTLSSESTFTHFILDTYTTARLSVPELCYTQ
jgi:hypothetical protein